MRVQSSRFPNQAKPLVTPKFINRRAGALWLGQGSREPRSRGTEELVHLALPPFGGKGERGAGTLRGEGLGGEGGRETTESLPA